MWGCQESPVEVSEQSVSSGSLEEERQANEVLASAEYKELMRLGKKAQTILLDALDRGVSKEAIATALKKEIGLLGRQASQGINMDSPTVGELVFGSDRKQEEKFHDEVRKAGQALFDKYPVLVKIREDTDFSEKCTPTEKRIDSFFTKLESTRSEGLDSVFGPWPGPYSANGTWQKTAACNACGGNCAAMLRTVGCIGLGGLVTGWSLIGLGYSAWLCGCQFCPMDLPSWMC